MNSTNKNSNSFYIEEEIDHLEEEFWKCNIDNLPIPK